MTVGRSRPLSGPSCVGSGGGWTVAECCKPRKEGLPWAVPSPAMASVRALWGKLHAARAPAQPRPPWKCQGNDTRRGGVGGGEGSVLWDAGGTPVTRRPWRGSWVQIPTPPLTGYVDFGSFLCQPQFPHM